MLELLAMRLWKINCCNYFLITGAVEGAFAAYEIYKLRKQRKRNHINKTDFKREVTKRVSGAAGATVGSVGAELVGQAICPLPVVGFAIGSVLGNIVGRWTASVVSGQIFDELIWFVSIRWFCKYWVNCSYVCKSMQKLFLHFYFMQRYKITT